MSNQNLVIIYTGNGKGKTSASLGLATRALRDKMKVIIIQFIKSEKESGEVGIKKVLPKLEVKCFGKGFITQKHGNTKTQKHNANIINKGMDFAKKIIKSGKYDVIILDEIFIALDLKLIQISVIIDLIKQSRKLSRNFLILTGRGCPKSLYKYADLVTEMKEIKHPFQKGIQAIKGIDF